jgi:hypothetical protein
LAFGILWKAYGWFGRLKVIPGPGQTSKMEVNIKDIKLVFVVSEILVLWYV